MRPFILAILACGSLLLATGTASAQSTVFDASVRDHLTRPSGACPAGASLCGQASIEGFGPAQYLFYVLSFAPTSNACGDYTATAIFTLGDGSTLTLDESGTACGAGPTFLKGPLFVAYGNPRTFSATWEVVGGTGQFSGMTGSGTDAGHTAGASLRASYRGTLED